MLRMVGTQLATPSFAHSDPPAYLGYAGVLACKPTASEDLRALLIDVELVYQPRYPTSFQNQFIQINCTLPSGALFFPAPGPQVLIGFLGQVAHIDAHFTGYQENHGIQLHQLLQRVLLFIG